MGLKRLCLAIIMLITVMACHDRSDTQSTFETWRAPIVNGNIETGFPAVGALVIFLEEPQVAGTSFCTATLISPTWVLTAAHCLNNLPETVAQDGLPPFEPRMVNFFVGNETEIENARYTQGTPHAAKNIHIHPLFTDEGDIKFYDIALIELEAPVDNVAPMEIFRGNLEDFLNTSPFYVGFGVNNGVTETGSGLKRSTRFPLIEILPAVYLSNQSDTGICYGDSGGPGLVVVDGALQVAGVNSAEHRPSNQNVAPCLGISSQTRVDAFQSWIDATMGAAQIDCNIVPTACACASACLPDGTCDPLRCGNPNCAEVADCHRLCSGNSACQLACAGSALPETKDQFTDYHSCLVQRCGTFSSLCLEQNCLTQTRACFGERGLFGGTESCEFVYRCRSGCESDVCRQDCFEDGSFSALVDYETQNNCNRDQCNRFASVPASYGSCMRTVCRDDLRICLPPDGCDVRGGSCPAGQACVKEVWGDTYCLPTQGAVIGEACSGSGVECIDGSRCANAGNGFQCLETCVDPQDCTRPGAQCPAFTGFVTGFGACVGGCADADSDGSCDVDDCAPDDPRINPNAPEACDNRIDDDCDTRIDEACDACVDVDGDGVCSDADCDDDDANMSPLANERCDGKDTDCDGRIDENVTNACGRCGSVPDEICDGIDNDCNGVADDGLASAATSCGLGACRRDGQTRCVGGVLIDQCTPGVPSTEVCDGIDNDCNGVTDEGLPDEATRCGIGECARMGVLSCLQGVSEDSCTPGQATSERCDGQDNDCDGENDEDLAVVEFQCGVGLCQRDGQKVCRSGQIESQCSPGAPAAEVCDGEDNDCDGQADEDLGTNAIQCGVGLCTRIGQRSCTDGAFRDNCSPGMPNPETCDNADNDCDGSVDEDLPPVATTCGIGTCLRQGVARCEGGLTIDSCQEGAPTAEICDGLDNDCDGATDENIPVVLTQCGAGACQGRGQRRCLNGAFIDSCITGQPADETCDGSDNDCDGRTDEDFNSEATRCGVGQCAETGRTLCVGGRPTDTCDPAPPTAEVCDGNDNDCDGQVDERVSSSTTTCGVGQCTRQGVLSCSNGRIIDSCVPAQPTAELCDGLDNDCDSEIDEDIPDSDTSCGQGACQSEGKVRCIAGRLEDDCRPGPASDETCDGLDNDCNGEVDDGLEAPLTQCGAGVCAREGRLFCLNGQRVDSCTPGPASVEACDGLDNDCDGVVDNGIGSSATVCGTGMCRASGLLTCNGGRLVDSCLPLPAVEEICDGDDNDCDGGIDEGLRNRCGECGPPPLERCNDEDDDCDGRIDEGVQNRCGDCGAEPVEICDGRDNDCDNRVDERVSNACGECGPEPIEQCNGRDDDCDSIVDENVRNSCGGCGPEPDELCNGADDDCDGNNDEGVLNACGTCGAVGIEICNGTDEDCDGKIDEGLLNPCGGCGEGPLELCDGTDRDCDGTIDEGCENCLDADGDGVCIEEDCDDDNPTKSPAETEICDSGLDEDCDGEIDEGCDEEQTIEGCNDTDRDGFCVPEDCNDERAALNPGAEELCENGLDEDCDGAIDENCPGCEAPDASGQCPPINCQELNEEDRSSLIEVCGNDVDDDCDDRIDEACMSCVDEDADGACLFDDCDDTSPNVRPGGVEVCGDEIDNDCDAEVDESCLSCEDMDGDGVCVPADCADTNPNISPLEAELCLNALDDDCDGKVDEGCACEDVDGDGSCPPDDCDDSNPQIGGPNGELCETGIDEDCDGRIDEYCDPPEFQRRIGGGGGCACDLNAEPVGPPQAQWTILGLLFLLRPRRPRRLKQDP